MVRQLIAALYRTVAVARRVVGLHGAFVIIAILRDGANALYGVFGLVECSEYLAQVCADSFVTDDDALPGTSLKVYVQDLQRVQTYTGGLSHSMTICQQNGQQHRQVSGNHANLFHCFYHNRVQRYK